MLGSRNLCWLLVWALAALMGSGCQAHSPDSPGKFTAHDSASAATDTEPLPDSFKGYELYAWGHASTLTFVLITGTNRQKTVAEITAAEYDVTTPDWVYVMGEGLDALKTLLARVPEQTSVVLTDLEGLPTLSEASREEVLRALVKP